jgi:hypothetical protein
MAERLRSNPNLTLHTENHYNGYPVLTSRGPLIEEYLEAILSTLGNALEDYSRVCVMLFVLRFPADSDAPDTAVISRFIDSLKAQIRADQDRKQRLDKRVHPCNLRYVWVKERDTPIHDHYHVAIIVNRDAYFTLGRFKTGVVTDYWGRPEATDTEAELNMSDRIKRAWASALGLDLWEADGLVHFPKNPTYRIDGRHPCGPGELADAFQRLSYFAKAQTKHFGDHAKSFGCSRKIDLKGRKMWRPDGE